MLDQNKHIQWKDKSPTTSKPNPMTPYPSHRPSFLTPHHLEINSEPARNVLLPEKLPKRLVCGVRSFRYAKLQMET